MTQQIGRLTHIGVARETSRGTARNPQFWIPKASIELFERAEKQRLDASLGVIDTVIADKITKDWVEGNIAGPVFDQSFGILLLNLFGSVSTALKGGESAVYNHIFSIAHNNQHPSLTFTKKDGNIDQQYVNAMLAKLDLELSLGAYIAYSADVKAVNGSTSSTTPDYSPLENHFLPSHVTIKLADDVASLAAAQAIEVTGFKMTIEKNLEDYQALGSTSLADIFNRNIVISGSIDLLLDDTTYRALGITNTQKAMSVAIQNTAVTIGSSSNPTLAFEFQPMNFEDWTETRANDEINKQTISFVATYNPTAGKSCQVTLTNTIGGYTGSGY